MLKRLEDKGFVQRSDSDRGFLYSPTVSETAAKKSALSEIVRVFFNGSAAGAATALLGMSDKLEGNELEQLEAMIARARQAKGEKYAGLLAIALKSVLISGLTLALLAIFKRRSSAERSWVAHIGMLALIVIAFAPLVLPNWNIETPAVFAPVNAPHASTTALPTGATQTIQGAAAPVAEAPKATVSSVAVAAAAYAVPAAILLFITFLALGRLLALRAQPTSWSTAIG